MEAKIKKRLATHHLVPEDLTADEMKRLKDEIETESEGGMVLDGVLSEWSLMQIEQRKYERIYGKN